MNGIEIGLALVMFAVTWLAVWPPRARRTAALICILLAAQTALLYTVLDARTLAIINRTELPEPSYHPIYIGLEAVKLLLLLYLTHLQLQEYEANIKKAARSARGPLQV